MESENTIGESDKREQKLRCDGSEKITKSAQGKSKAKHSRHAGEAPDYDAVFDPDDDEDTGHPYE